MCDGHGYLYCGHSLPERSKETSDKLKAACALLKMSVQGANIDRRSLKRHHSQIHRTLGRTGASIREGVGVRTPSGNKTPHTESGPQERAVCTTTITQESRALEKALKLEEVHITPCNLGLPSVMLGESCHSRTVSVCPRESPAFSPG